jgi:hypothetical protein
MVLVAMATPKSAPFDQQKDSVFSFAKPQSEDKKKMSAFRSLANLVRQKDDLTTFKDCIRELCMFKA